MTNYGPASKYYDLFESKDDITFYKEMARRCGAKALELGVGTGRVAIELARANVLVWGIDNSRYMLNVARMKLKNESESVRKNVVLKLGDMRDFELEEKFPFVYLASSTFEHCLTETDQTKCLTSIHNVLESRGVLAFDVSQSDSVKPESSWWIDRREIEEGEVVRTILSKRDPRTSVVSVNLFFEVYHKGKMKEKYYELGLAKISSGEKIKEILESTGFEILDEYGTFYKSRLEKNSQMALFVARKP